MPRTLMVTSALPYANGPLHLGHLLEHIQTDIWVRTHRMLGHECISLCGDDAHGTPIMLKAEQLNCSPETMTARIKNEHEYDFQSFGIMYDAYHTTHSAENQALAEHIYTTLNNHGDILKKTIRQLFDPTKQLFLPDRYVKGTCPKCHAIDQYGDNCEACGATYLPTDLIHPKSALSGATPIEKESEHYFFNLPNYESKLKSWIKNNHLQIEMTHKMEEWFAQGLIPWDISRDAPYFGFKIPKTEDKYFYVWLDAPIGYMASCQKFCTEHQRDFNEFWKPDSPVELYHFVGKDIIYFHALFWPALLMGSGYRTPTAIFTHGFLTVNGQKMSKSRGTFIEAAHYLKHLDPEYLRYYFAAKSNGSIEDIDLNFSDFMQRINADLVGKMINIASRCAGFVEKHFDGQLSSTLIDETLWTHILSIKDQVIQSYLDRDYARSIRSIMDATAQVNQYIDSEKPWLLIKNEGTQERAHNVVSLGLNLFRVLMGYLKPILPALAKEVEFFLNCDPLLWENLASPLTKHSIQPFKPLLKRIEAPQIEALLHPGQA